MTIPLAIGVFAYGLVFGMLASQKGMTSAEALLMSLTVFAGASQIIATELWIQPLSAVTIILTTFIINARHLLMGAAVQPYFKHLSPWQAYLGIFFCADENWALAMSQFKKGEKDAAFLVGGGFAIYLFWAVATYLGYIGGLVVGDPRQYGLDFAFTAVFIALLAGLWEGKKDLIPWLFAAVIIGMALVTCLTRMGGLWMMNRVTITERLSVWLKALPAAILVSIIAPNVLSGNLPELGAAVGTAFVARFSKNVILLMTLGVLFVWLLRRF